VYLCTAPCAVGEFQCQTGSCIHGNGQCDGVVDCPDGSDEADCGMSVTYNRIHRINNQLVLKFYEFCLTFPPHRFVSSWHTIVLLLCLVMSDYSDYIVRTKCHMTLFPRLSPHKKHSEKKTQTSQNE